AAPRRVRPSKSLPAIRASAASSPRWRLRRWRCKLPAPAKRAPSGRVLCLTCDRNRWLSRVRTGRWLRISVRQSTSRIRFACGLHGESIAGREGGNELPGFQVVLILSSRAQRGICLSRVFFYFELRGVADSLNGVREE